MKNKTDNENDVTDDKSLCHHCGFLHRSIHAYSMQHTAIEIPTKLDESALPIIKEIASLCNVALASAMHSDKHPLYFRIEISKSKLRIIMEGVDREISKSMMQKLVSENFSLSPPRMT